MMVLFVTHNLFRESATLCPFQQVFAINQAGENKVEPWNNQHADDGARKHPTNGR